ncbi:MAG: hypothetical protein QOH19_2739 [Actinomycetota bacterium]|jgi:UDP:flavonoid glycosyltransferase YjiC (YdhE family)|nr:hypothetical protein [Actinomycetota bacterium]
MIWPHSSLGASVLRHADVFLSHAGMNSTMEALCFGVPLVTFPLRPEQEATARRVEELGLGRRLAAEGIRTETRPCEDNQS